MKHTLSGYPQLSETAGHMLLADQMDQIGHSFES